MAVAANERFNARLQRGDKHRTFSRLAVKASIFTNAFAPEKRKKRNATRESLSKRREREKTCLSMLSCVGRHREIETIARIARSSDLIIISLISSIVLSSSLLSAVSRLIVRLVSSMLHLSRVSSHFPHSSPNTTIVTSFIASHYFVAANRDDVDNVQGVFPFHCALQLPRLMSRDERETLKRLNIPREASYDARIDFWHSRCRLRYMYSLTEQRWCFRGKFCRKKGNTGIYVG